MIASEINEICSTLAENVDVINITKFNNFSEKVQNLAITLSAIVINTRKGIIEKALSFFKLKNGNEMKTLANRIELYNKIQLNLTESKNIIVNYKDTYLFKLLASDKFYNKFDVVNIIQSGAFGSVYTSIIDLKTIIATKIARAPQTSKDFLNAEFKTPSYFDEYNLMKEKNNLGSYTWREWFALEIIIKPLILKGKCPNLPLMYNMFISENAFLPELEDFQKIPDDSAAIYILEYANGGIIKKWLESDEQRTEEDYFIALFQIMAGLHAIQLNQLVNNDIKYENILVYNIPKISNTYFCYIIDGNEYYIKNNGYLFIISDFGIATCYSPKYSIKSKKKTGQYGTNLGNRSVMIIDNEYTYLDWVTPNMRLTQPKSFETINDLIFYTDSFQRDTEIKNIPNLTNAHGSDIVMNSKYNKSGFVLNVSKNEEIKYKKKKIKSTGSKDSTIVEFGYNTINQTPTIKPEILFTQKQIDYINSNSNLVDDCTIKYFYDKPMIIPPTELRIDTQDTLRMFCSGKVGYNKLMSRFNQPEYHPEIKIHEKNKQIYNNFISFPLSDESQNLSKYLFEPVAKMRPGSSSTISDNLLHKFEKPSKDLAGYFIHDFFGNSEKYTSLPDDGVILETYVIDN